MPLDAPALLVIGACVALVCVLAFYRSSGSRPYHRLKEKLLQKAEDPPALLLLGPAGSGKSTIFQGALTLAGEKRRDAAPAPTRGLVRSLMYLPDKGGQQPVLVCDAGGGRQERRQWIELMRELDTAAGGVLVFFSDAHDDSEDSRDLFRQLATSRWARRAKLLLALTKLDVVLEERGAEGARALCRHRAEAFWSTCPSRQFTVHCLDCRVPVDARRLLVGALASRHERQASDAAAGARGGAANDGEGASTSGARDHGRGACTWTWVCGSG
jgi:hypothetical protein